MSTATEFEPTTIEQAPEVKARKYTALTPEQKKAAALRRLATTARQLGHETQAIELEAEADAIAPQKPQASRIDPLKQLTQKQQDTLRKGYFETTKSGFARIAALVSYNRLAAIADQQEGE